MEVGAGFLHPFSSRLFEDIGYGYDFQKTNHSPLIRYSQSNLMNVCTMMSLFLASVFAFSLQRASSYLSLWYKETVIAVKSNDSW